MLRITSEMALVMQINGCAAVGLFHLHKGHLTPFCFSCWCKGALPRKGSRNWMETIDAILGAVLARSQPEISGMTLKDSPQALRTRMDEDPCIKWWWSAWCNEMNEVLPGKNSSIITADPRPNLLCFPACKNGNLLHHELRVKLCLRNLLALKGREHLSAPSSCPSNHGIME